MLRSLTGPKDRDERSGRHQAPSDVSNQQQTADHPFGVAMSRAVFLRELRLLASSEHSPLIDIHRLLSRQIQQDADGLAALVDAALTSKDTCVQSCRSVLLAALRAESVDLFKKNQAVWMDVSGRIGRIAFKDSMVAMDVGAARQSFSFPQPPYFSLLFAIVTRGNADAFSELFSGHVSVFSPANWTPTALRSFLIDLPLKNCARLKSIMESTAVSPEARKRFLIATPSFPGDEFVESDDPARFRRLLLSINESWFLHNMRTKALRTELHAEHARRPLIDELARWGGGLQTNQHSIPPRRMAILLSAIPADPVALECVVAGGGSLIDRSPADYFPNFVRTLLKAHPAFADEILSQAESSAKKSRSGADQGLPASIAAIKREHVNASIKTSRIIRPSKPRSM